MSLPRPGILGRTLRLGLAIAVGWLAVTTWVEAPSYFDGLTDPLSAVPLLIILTILSSWVVDELLQKDWGPRPAMALLAGLAVAAAIGAWVGDPFGPIFGTYVWVWAMMFSWLLFPAHLLAALLATPGCEMRSYAHLWRRMRGGDVDGVACPGWIDRLDHVRVFGR